MTISKIRSEIMRGPEIEQSVLPIETNENRLGYFESAHLAGLMLGIQLRENLSQQDRMLLGKLAPPDRTVFLVHRGRFVHPENFDAFPLEYIGGCADEQAFFSHRFFPDGDRSGRATTIQTAALNPGEPDSLVIGWFGPEVTSFDGSWDHRFSRLVADLRHTYSESAALVHRLQGQLESEVPTLIVDRLTGRVLWLNKPAAELCGQERSALVDLRFERVRSMLSPTLAGRRLIMRRVSEGDIEVTMVTLPKVNASKHPTNRFVTDFLIHPSQQKLAGIIMAAELLKSSLSDHGDREGVELCSIIAGDARQLDDLVNKQMLLLGDITDDASHASLVAQTELAIDRVNRGRKLLREVQIHDLTDGSRVSAPGETFTALADAILRSHDTCQDSGPATTVTFEPDESNDDIIIRFETEATGAGGVDADLWLEYARRLALRLGYEQFSHKSVTDILISTEMRVNPHKVLETQ